VARKVTTADLGPPEAVKAMEIQDARDNKVAEYVAMLQEHGITARRVARIGPKGLGVLGKVRNLRAPSATTHAAVLAALRQAERAKRGTTMAGRPRTTCRAGDYPKPGKVGNPRGLKRHITVVHDGVEPTSKNGARSTRKRTPRARSTSPGVGGGLTSLEVLALLFPNGIPVESLDQLERDLGLVDAVFERTGG